MSQRRWRFSTRTSRWFVCCCLLVALPLCGLSTLLSTLLGPMHLHEPAAVAAVDAGSMAGWQDFRRVNHVTDSVVHVHDHSKLGRHHHDSTDAGLVIVGAGDHDDSTDGAAAGATGTIVMAASEAASLQLPAPSNDSLDWLAPAACQFQSCDSRRLDRPPIA